MVKWWSSEVWKWCVLTGAMLRPTKKNVLLKYFYKPASDSNGVVKEDQWKCLICEKSNVYSVISQKIVKGISNLERHLDTHGSNLFIRSYNKIVEDSGTKKQITLDALFNVPIISDGARSIYAHLEAVVKDNQPFSFAESAFVRRHCTLKQISSRTLVCYVYAIYYLNIILGKIFRVDNS